MRRRLRSGVYWTPERRRGEWDGHVDHPVSMRIIREGGASRGRGTTVSAPSVRMELLGGFRLVGATGPIPVAPAGERLLALLALKPGGTREAVAWRMWIDHTEERALACLRSTVWRLPRPGGRSLVTTTPGHLELAPEVEVDALRLRDDLRGGVPDRGADPVDDDLLIERLARELLPSWYDDWLVVERERFRQLRLHALESLADALVRAGRAGQALQAGLCAVECEPLRESAHRCVVRAHLAEGNVGEALGQVRRYLRALSDAGIPAELSGEMEALLGPRLVPLAA